MKVILAGYSKTGTKTMCQAFQILGYNTYDSLEHGYYHYREWVKIITKGSTSDDFQRMYDGVDAVTDAPSFIFWEQIHEAFPEAKIILTIRDEDKWYQSFENQRNVLNSSYMYWFLQFACPSLLVRRNFNYHIMKLFGDVALFPRSKITTFSETLLKSMYRQHNAYVKEKAPKDKLLVYEVSQGWSPLCEFLGEDVPSCPFPYKNKGGSVIGEMIKENKIMQTYIRQALLSTGVATIFMSYIGYKIYRKVDFGRLYHIGVWHLAMLKDVIWA